MAARRKYHRGHIVWLDEMDGNVMSCTEVLFDRRGAAVERVAE
jgi:hypothetical protein